MRHFSQTPEDAPDDGRKGYPELPPVPRFPRVPSRKRDAPGRAPEHTDQGPEQYRQMGLAYSLPMALAAPIVVLTLGGWWLDERLHKSPWLTLAGALIGTVTGFINMIRIANRLSE